MIQKKINKKNQILMIDAEESRSRDLALNLKKSGYQVKHCSNGFQAIHLLESSESQKDYLLVTVTSDVGDMPGREVLLLLREIFTKQELPVIFFISQKDNNVETILQMADAGANDCMLISDSFERILFKVQQLTGN